MTVHCPHCSTGYLLPDHLVGAHGSRVRCPSCRGAFVVLPENGHATTPECTVPALETGPVPAPRADDGLARDPNQLAAEILDRLASRLGDQLERARRRATILSEHGPALLDAYDEFRRLSGTPAAPEIFRASLRDRWGLDLSPTRAS